MVYILTQTHTLQIPLFRKEGLGEICIAQVLLKVSSFKNPPQSPFTKGEAGLSKMSTVILSII